MGRDYNNIIADIIILLCALIKSTTYRERIPWSMLQWLVKIGRGKLYTVNIKSVCPSVIKLHACITTLSTLDLVSGILSQQYSCRVELITLCCPNCTVEEGVMYPSQSKALLLRIECTIYIKVKYSCLPGPIVKHSMVVQQIQHESLANW